MRMGFVIFGLGAVIGFLICAMFSMKEE